jgi:cytochrome bd-type quinol oxidase subunit 1
MSLKFFHVVFVTTATVLSLAGAHWAFQIYQQSQRLEMKVVGVSSILIAVALLVYGVWFYRKLQTHPAYRD